MTDEEFKTRAFEIFKLGGTVDDLADVFGMTNKQVRDKLYQLRRKGVDMPNFNVPPSLRGDDSELAIKLRMLELKLKAAQREAKQLKDQIAAQRNLEEMLSEQIACWDTIPPKQLDQPAPTAEHSQSAFLYISDVHAGQLVSSSEVGGLGIYNWEMLQQRSQKLFAKTCNIINLHRAIHPVDRVNVLLGGDMVEGHNIFTGQGYVTEAGVKQCTQVAQEVSRMLYRLVDTLDLEMLQVYAVVGNHGNPGGRRGGVVPIGFNYDYLVYSLIAAQLRNQPRIQITISESWYITFEIYRWFCVAIHGDEIRNYLGLPYYAIDRAHKRYEEMLGRYIPYFFVAHFHQPAIIPSSRGSKILNGAWIGATNLTKQTQQATVPSQQLCFFHPIEGLTAHYELHLDTIQPPNIAVHNE